LAIVAAVAIIRRSGLGFWASAIAAATIIIAAVALIAAHGRGFGDLTLRYSDVPTQNVAIAEGLLSDTSWLGSGAGTYPALAPIYQASGDASALIAPTGAAKIAIELGRPALWSLIVMALAATALLLHGALTRGRDSLYATAVAGSTIVLMLEPFCDAGSLSTSPMIIAAATLGLGLAQSVSRTFQQPS
jgi:hypothetical protein